MSGQGGKIMSTSQKSSHALVILAWLFAGIPLAWGVILTLDNAMQLFR